MEAGELHIGSIVDQGSYGPTPCTAYEIYNYYRYKEGAPVAEYYKHWKPTLLTGDWMKDLGLIQFTGPKPEDSRECYSIEFGPWHYSVQRDPNDKEGWILFIEVDGIAAPPSIYIKWVHQLQNTYFFLTGMKDELTLKK